MSSSDSSKESTDIPDGEYIGHITNGLFVETCNRHKVSARIYSPNGQTDYVDTQYSGNEFKAMLDRCKTHSFSELKKRELLIDVKDEAIFNIQPKPDLK